MNFGEALKTARKSQGTTQKELAKVLAISNQYLCEIENSKRIPSHKLAEKLDAIYPEHNLLNKFNNLN